MRPGEIEAFFAAVDDRHPECHADTLAIVRAEITQWHRSEAKRRAKYWGDTWEELGGGVDG